MSNYLRPRRSGARIFFTVALADRGARTLVEQIEPLRQAVRVTRAERPFRIDAWVVLSDHMHCVWILPEGDSDYSVRMAAIKARFTRVLTGNDRRVGFHPTTTEPEGRGSGGNNEGGGNPTLRLATMLAA